ncbi:MAG TPA: hypothetical protein IAB01_00005 [Candidatus Avidesulfovibrio excrementigallinarum]|nr:hypothetical protein [Candidatus Avidesulfovibrio excrementigallinarum]
MPDRTYCTPQDAKALFQKHGEFAVLDVREQEEFSRSHMLLASCVPLSRIELMVEALVPCKQIPVLLVDEGGEPEPARAERAADVLTEMGYTTPIVLRGGMAAWRQAGYVDFNGVGALSKGFGEYVEEQQNTPRLEPAEIKKLLDSDAKTVVIDVRPRNEFNIMNIPGAINAPGCEVTYRVADLVPDADTTIVINCAGRTRSIIGTQTLINAGLPNRVVALKGGTMNWQLAGFTLDYGTTLRTAPPSLHALDVARERACRVAKACGVRFIDATTLDGWRKEAESKTLYIFDVRQPEEYNAGHLPGSRNAQGGQLVQATDEYAAVRNARFVLVDDTEVRAIMTAHWLIQMGYPEIYVLKGGLGQSGLGARGLLYGPEPAASVRLPELPTISAAELSTQLEEPNPPLIINVGTSKGHRVSHIPGAVWVPRSYLRLAGELVAKSDRVVMTSDTELHAALAAHDAIQMWPDVQIAVLRGGNAGWQAAGLAAADGMPVALAAEDDVWYKPYTDINAKPETMKSYFDWEFGLVEQIRKDGDVAFRLIPPMN